LSTLGKQAMPMLRYRTRDITSLETAICSCGRTTRRIKRISTRSDDMLIIRGVNVFPSQIETALLRVDSSLAHYQIVVSRKDYQDILEVKVELTPQIACDTVSKISAMEKKISHSIEQIINIRAIVKLVQPHTLVRSEGKIKRVTDLRISASTGLA